MANATPKVIEVLRTTAKRISQGARYQWGHMGSCNCGHLAQTVTKLSKAQIHAYALEKGSGEWVDQVVEFCPTSGYPMDYIIETMLAIGFTRDDLRHLEKLSCRQVLKQLPADNRYLRHNVRDDVVLYMYTWAEMLEQELYDNLPVVETYPVTCSIT